METTSVSLKPTISGEDTIIQRFVQQREQTMSKVIDKLREKIDKPNFLEAIKLVQLFSALPMTARQQILMHPHYHHWWFRLFQHYKDGDRQNLQLWLPEFARFLVVPALRYECFPEEGLQVPMNTIGQLRFPGHFRHIFLSEMTELGAAHLVRQDDALVVEYQGQKYSIGLDDLLDQKRSITHPLICQRPSISGTQIEVDSSDPWITEFLDLLNITEAVPPNTRGDMQPVSLQSDELQWLTRALTLIGDCWPEMYAEINEYVRLVVPFSSNYKNAFTNTNWLGAVFLRATFENQVYAVERLVHETSHLRLNLIMTQETLHYHDWNDRVSSPFRPGLRPVTGLYHGAFVVTRSAQALDRAFSLTGDLKYRQRIQQVVNQVVQALETLKYQVRLAPLGQEMLDEISSEIETLQSKHPEDTQVKA